MKDFELFNSNTCYRVLLNERGAQAGAVWQCNLCMGSIFILYITYVHEVSHFLIAFILPVMMCFYQSVILW